MMDDKKNIEADDLEFDEDLDFDDLDTDEDFEESWDEFDDAEAPPAKTAKNNAGKAEGTGAAAGVMSPLKQKTFLQKNFTVIAVVLVVAFGGLFFLGQSSTRAPQNEMQQQENIALPDQSPPPIMDMVGDLNSGVPPMPNPMESLPDQNTAQFDDVLTPLPELSDIPEPELAALDVELDTQAPDTEAAPTPQPIEQDPAFDLNTLEFADVNQEPVPEVEAAAEPAPAELPLEMAADVPAAAMPDALIPTEAPAPVAPVIDQHLETELATLRTTMEAERQTAQQTIDALNTKIASLQDQIEKLEEQQSAAPAPATSPPVKVSPPPAEPAAKATPSVPPTKPVITAKTQTRPAQQPAPAKAATKWTMRSAMPGSAMLSPIGSEDIRQVGVGDNLPGIGKITAIGLENGLWTVRGTQGIVTQ